MNVRGDPVSEATVGDRILRLAQVEQVIGLKRSWIYAAIKAGGVPRARPAVRPRGGLARYRCTALARPAPAGADRGDALSAQGFAPVWWDAAPDPDPVELGDALQSLGRNR